MPGSMRQRGENSWNLRVYAGRDPITGRKFSIERTVRGNKREASKVLAAMVAEVDQRPIGSLGKGTLARLCREWLDIRLPQLLAEDRRDHADVHRGPDHSRPRIHTGREAHAGESGPLLPPAARGRSLPRAVRAGHHPTCPRHHSKGSGSGCPLGLDHPQPGHRRFASPGADEGAEATRSRSGRATLPTGPGVRPRAGHLHSACRIVGGPAGRASCAALERHRPSRGKALDRARHRPGWRRRHRTGHEDASKSADLHSTAELSPRYRPTGSE